MTTIPELDEVFNNYKSTNNNSKLYIGSKFPGIQNQSYTRINDSTLKNFKKLYKKKTDFKIIRQYYLDRGAKYIQITDALYKLSDDDPLNLSDSMSAVKSRIPIIDGILDFTLNIKEIKRQNKSDYYIVNFLKLTK